MSRKRSEAAIEAYHERFIEGAARVHGVDAETAERVYQMIVGFSGFGFPKAHGAAFGLLAYQSTWLRVHYAPEFLCALLNEQPMGFYAPDSLAHEAQRKGIELIAPDVNLSGEECTVDAEGRIRLGLNYVLGARSAEVAALVAAREEGGPFRSLADLASRAGAGRAVLDRLAWAGACDSLAAAEEGAGGAARARRTALWRLGVAAPGTAVGDDGTQLALPLELPGAPGLQALPGWDAMIADYATTGLTLGTHPAALMRSSMPANAVTTRDLETLRARVAGGHRRARHRPPAAGHRQGHRLPPARGRARDDQPDRPARRLRAPPAHGALRAAAARPGRLEKLAGGRRSDQRVRPRRCAASTRRARPAAASSSCPRAVGRAGSPPSRWRRGRPARGRAVGRDFRGVAPAVQSFAAGRRR